ncbi:hypothetical protein [Lishizhenia sp.]|uniref:hypothetical protein n=1 Tax=Lishizhenia sp. TaxID=2497594 RepID=UPI00299CEB3F|nr:hypothetical protein [Lishizhenia sp.]MDX1445702.1 hypothetical protein [Lishizhenia sp.]
MTHIFETAKKLCITAWKYGYKISNSSVYNESGLRIVKLSQDINLTLHASNSDTQNIEETKTKISDYKALLEKLMNMHPQQKQYLEEMNTYLTELVSGLNLGGQVKAA